MDKIKYGVIGAGFFGEKHIEVLSTLPNVKLAGICRRSIEPLKQIAKKYNIPNIYTDYRELLANKEIEVVSITTHVNDHLRPTIDALKSGKHVFLEKPMARNVSECDEIIKTVQSTNKFFMVGHICRFDPRYAIAKRNIDEGKIGRIVSIYARRNIPASVSESVLEKISPVSGDMIHDIDLMLWFTGEKIKSVYSNTLSVRNLPNPDIGWSMLKFKSGAIGVCESVWFLPEKTPYDLDARMEIIGEKGAIYIGGPGESLSINTDEGWKCPETVYWPKVHGEIAGALKEELSYFANCLLSGKKPTIITPEESRKAVEAIEAAEESARKGEVVILK
jgi:UDP-N-acetylglucosamine 3-dehydrogenase